jgi:hypothetical protein
MATKTDSVEGAKFFDPKKNYCWLTGYPTDNLTQIRDAKAHNRKIKEKRDAKKNQIEAGG